MESMTDCAFSWPISVARLLDETYGLLEGYHEMRRGPSVVGTYVGSSLPHCANGSCHYCELCARSWSRG